MHTCILINMYDNSIIGLIEKQSIHLIQIKCVKTAIKKTATGHRTFLTVCRLKIDLNNNTSNLVVYYGCVILKRLWDHICKE